LSVGSKSTSRARHLALLAPLAVATAAVVLGARGGVVRWQPASARSDSNGRVLITSNRVLGLYPGARKSLILTLHNRDTRRSVRIRRIGVRDVATTKRGCAASPRNLRISEYAGDVLTIPPGGGRSVALRMTMPYTVANACQRATFTLRYTAETAVTRRR
jgi:hypothetical protein